MIKKNMTNILHYSDGGSVWKKDRTILKEIFEKLRFVKYKNMLKLLVKKKSSAEYLKYSFIDNSILLKTRTIEKNGFHEVWRQENNKHSIQILCFNETTGEFRAFDRFHWMNEPIYDDFTCGTYYKEDLWTPINLHYTEKWLKEHLICSTN